VTPRHRTLPFLEASFAGKASRQIFDELLSEIVRKRVRRLQKPLHDLNCAIRKLLNMQVKCFLLRYYSRSMKIRQKKHLQAVAEVFYRKPKAILIPAFYNRELGKVALTTEPNLSGHKPLALRLFFSRCSIKTQA